MGDRDFQNHLDSYFLKFRSSDTCNTTVLSNTLFIIYTKILCLITDFNVYVCKLLSKSLNFSFHMCQFQFLRVNRANTKPSHHGCHQEEDASDENRQGRSIGTCSCLRTASTRCQYSRRKGL